MTGDSFLDQYFNESRRRDQQTDSKRRRSSVAGAYVATLDLRLASGTRVALPYSTLLKTTFDPSTGITLEYSTDTVTITGRRLGPIYKAIAQHRLSTLKAVGDRAGLFDKDNGGPVVVAIVIRPAE